MDQRKTPGVIPPHDGYQDLMSYRMAEVVHDATAVFCSRFIDKRSRTNDQMVQAARSGKQNIAEGCMVSGTSKKTELKLIGVARASPEELLIDYKDFLRTRNLSLWGKDHAMAKKVRGLCYVKDRTYKTYRTYIQDSDAETAGNTMVCVINQTNYLLDQQLRALEKEFLEKGGFTERLYRVRHAEREDRIQNKEKRDR